MNVGTVALGSRAAENFVRSLRNFTTELNGPPEIVEFIVNSEIFLNP